MPLKALMVKIQELMNSDEFDEHQFDKLFNEDNVNEVIFEEWTPLTYAIFCHNLKAVNFFIELGADINLPGSEKRTPLIQALYMDAQDIVDVLMHHKVNIPLYDEQGTSLLRVAIHYNVKSLIRILVENLNANVNEVDEDTHTTPLINAAEEGYLDIVKLLLRHGAKVNFTPKSGLSPMAAAAINHHLPIVYFLLHEGADLTRAKQSIKTRLEDVLNNESEDIEEEISRLRSGFELLIDAAKEDIKNDLSHNRFEFFNARHDMNRLKLPVSSSSSTNKDKNGGG